MLIMALLLNFKLIYEYETLFSIQWFLFYNLTALLFIDIFAASVLLYLLINKSF